MLHAIAVEGVTKTFGSTVAVRDLELLVPQGALYGFIGPNGAGKTTTIRMIMSILFPDRGTLRVLGHASALEAKDRIGYLPEERGVYRKMKVRAFLTYMARLKGCGAGAHRRVGDWLDRVGLADVAEKKCEELSKGMQQKVQFIASVLHQPDLLILDEPFSGFDPVNARLMRDLVLEQHRRGATVIFSTHVMVQAEQICDHIVMIHDGSKVLDSSLPEIRRRHDPRTVLFEALDAGLPAEALERIPGVAGVRRADGVWELSLAEDLEPAAAIQRIVATVPPARIELRRPTLEDVFIAIVAGAGGAAIRDEDRLRALLRDGAPRAGVGAASS